MIEVPPLGAPLANHPLAALLDRAGPVGFADEPLYTPLCSLIARSPGLLALLDAAPPTQRLPNLILAALHHEVLREAETPGALSAFAAYFGSVGGTRVADAELPAALADFATRHRARLRELIATRRTQTNEVGRCAVLRPALDEIARRHGTELALFDFGCSAGLNLAVDRYALHYGDALPTDDTALRCRLVGTPPPGLHSPPAWRITHRHGTDQAPVDVQDPDAVRWLQACLWPGDAHRRARFSAALAHTRALRPPVTGAEDGLAVLEDWLATLPSGAQPVLFNSWVLAYFTPVALAAHVARVQALVQRFGLLWLSAEDAKRSAAVAPGLALQGPTLPADVPSSAAADTWWVLTSPATGQGTPQTRLLARSHPHGAWLQWLG